MKFLLIDDHALFREGLRLLLERLPGNHEFLVSDNCEAAFAAAAAHKDIDLVLLDLVLPGMNGLDGLTRLRKLCPAAPIVLLSANDSRHVVIDGMRRGAAGFIPKSASPEVMMAALQVVLAGGTYLPAPEVSQPNASSDGGQALTERQRQVLALIAQDHTNKEIAEALGMRVNTVRVHVAAIFKALGVDNRVDAARLAFGLGINPHAG